MVNTAIKFSYEEKRNRRKSRQDALKSKSLLRESSQRLSNTIPGANPKRKSSGSGTYSQNGNLIGESDARIRRGSTSRSDRSSSPTLGILDGSDKARGRERRRSSVKDLIPIPLSASFRTVHDPISTSGAIQKFLTPTELPLQPNLYGENANQSHGMSLARDRVFTPLQSSSPSQNSAPSSPRMSSNVKDDLGPTSDSDSELCSSGDEGRSRSSTMTGTGSMHADQLLSNSKVLQIFSDLLNVLY